MILAIASKWSGVMQRSRRKKRRTGIISVIAIAWPERMAPATKYGTKMVLCQPASMPMAKSHATTECTDTASGVASAAKKR